MNTEGRTQGENNTIGSNSTTRGERFENNTIGSSSIQNSQVEPEPRWLQYLRNRQRRREEIMNNIDHENFEYVDEESPEDNQSSRLGLVRSPTFYIGDLPNQGINRHMLSHIQQSNHDYEIELWWQSELSNQQIQRLSDLANQGIQREAIMNNIGRENFEVVDECPENISLCPICQENYVLGEEIGRLDCAHRFHMDCIQEWLLIRNVCPLCNRMGLYVNNW